MGISNYIMKLIAGNRAQDAPARKAPRQHRRRHLIHRQEVGADKM